MPSTSGVPKRLILVLVFFNIFFIDLNNRAERTLCKFPDERKTGEMAHVPDDCGVVHNDLKQAGEMACQEYHEFSKGKQQVSLPWRKIPMCNYTVEADWLKDSLAKTDLRVSVIKNLYMNNVPSSQRNTIAFRDALGKTLSAVILFLSLGKTHLELWVYFWAALFCERKTGTCQFQSSKGLSV